MRLCSSCLESPFNDVEILFPYPDQGQVIGQDMNAGHDDLIRVAVTNLIQVEPTGVDDPGK